MGISDFLIWLTTSAGSAAALSFIAERIPAFHTLTPRAKSLVHLVGSLAIALAAYAVLTYVPSEILAKLTPWFQLVAGVFVAWAANQFTHSHDPANVQSVDVTADLALAEAIATDPLRHAPPPLPSAAEVRQAQSRLADDLAEGLDGYAEPDL